MLKTNLKNRNMRKWIILLIFLVIAIIGYNYIYQDHRSIENENAEFVLTSDNLSNEFVINSVEAEQKYLNKTIEVSGLVSELNKNNLTLDGKLFCQFTNEINAQLKQNLKIKGRFIGYDDLLEQIKLDQCTIIN
jgi:cell division protein FtsL